MNRGPYRAALYMRLSRDDEGVGESASIATQRDMLRAFAAAQGIGVAGEYADDGYSGTRFDRPELQRMLRDIEAGVINCVITKDLSRLGRNSARTAELLEELFPRRGVRFIAICDGFDSLSLSQGMEAATPFMLLMNEYYARDISRKIRASFQAKMRRGDYVSAFAPFGYRKDPANKNRLLPDPEAAGIVRMIFRMAADGSRPHDIAAALNARRIPTPASYRAGLRSGADGDGRDRVWSSSMLCKLLRNRVYLGQTEHGKTTRLSFKSRETRANPREEWIVVKGTHEALVSPELFEAAQRRSAARRCAPSRGFVNAFSGLAVCADCGRRMTTAPTRKRGSRAVLCCGGYKAHGARACSNHFLDYEQLCRIVSAELRALLTLTEADRQAIALALAREEDARVRAEREGAAARLRKKERRLRELPELIRNAFEQYTRGLLPEAPYLYLTAGYEREREELEAAVSRLRPRLEAVRPAPDVRQALDELLSGIREADPPPLLLRTLIDRIEVGQGLCETDAEGRRYKRQTVTIVYRFSDLPGPVP